MKTLIITVSLFIYVNCLCAQGADIETEIRNLEKMEVQAVLAMDTVTLLKLWDKDFTVNAPDNVINNAGKSTLDRPVLKRPRTSFTREIEQIMIRGNVVISMGSETVVPAGDQPQSGEIVKRRYTNIWMKQADGWKLVARHANVICKPK